MEFVVAGVVLVALAGWVVWLYRRQGVWTKRLARQIPVHSAYWREQKKRDGGRLYVALGDSAAQGIGASRPQYGYAGILAARLPGWRVANLGISGATLATVIESELPSFRKLQPDLVTVSAGANDIATFDAERFAREIGVIFDALPPHAIVATLPSFHFLPAERRVRVANAIIEDAAAARHLAVAPLHALTRKQGLWGVTRDFAGDLFHPNNRGYRVWASAFEPLVEARLRELE